MIDVEFFQGSNGRVPALAFITEIDDVRLKAKVYRSLKLLQEFGSCLLEPYAKYLRNGIFELRTSYGSKQIRTLYFYTDSGKAVITNAFMKKTRRTPDYELETAVRRKTEYEKRK